MKKVLILQNEISAYNVEVYNYIAEKYELTLGYYLKDKSAIECKFSKIKLDYKQYGPFVKIKGLRKLVKEYDLVCFVPNMRIVDYCLLPFGNRKYKAVSWSIGFRCSYVHPYITDRKHVFADRIFQYLLSKCDSNIFYMEKSKEFWKDTKLRKGNIFIAPNTTNVLESEFDPLKKKNILFVGSLYRGKGLDLLLKSYHHAISQNPCDSKLVIVGNGEMRSELETYVTNNKLNDNVIFTGGIFDESRLVEHFEHAIISVSPTQAGLSVPKSMGYGVPFVTKKDAITGGEVYHIHDGVDGIMYTDDDQLSSIIQEAISNPSKYIEMGAKAKEYYFSKATTAHMAKGAMDAFEYAFNQ